MKELELKESKEGSGKKDKQLQITRELKDLEAKTYCPYGSKCEHVHMDFSSFFKLAGLHSAPGLQYQISYVKERRPYVSLPASQEKRGGSEVDNSSEVDGSTASGSGATRVAKGESE